MNLVQLFGTGPQAFGGAQQDALLRMMRRDATCAERPHHIIAQTAAALQLDRQIEVADAHALQEGRPGGVVHRALRQAGPTGEFDMLVNEHCCPE